MPIPNPSFEDAGANSGDADQWSVSVLSAGGAIADFAEDAPKPVEDFEGASWGTDAFIYAPTGMPVAFDADEAPQPNNAETFGRWKSNEGYQTIVSGGVAVVFSGPATAETFSSSDWGTAGYATEVVDPTTELETFEAPGWGAHSAIVSGGTTVSFDRGTSDVEDFEEAEGDVLFFVSDEATGLCAVPTGVHGKSNGDRVTLKTTGALPTGTAANIPYYVIVVSTTTFRISKTNGGAAVVFSSLGSGSLYLHADERYFWTVTE